MELVPAVIENPRPILQQPSSNNFNHVNLRKTEVNKRKTEVEGDVKSLEVVGRRMADSVLGVMDDIYNKPKTENWKDYLATTILKDDRYAYIGMLCILITIYILLVKK